MAQFPLMYSVNDENPNGNLRERRGKIKLSDIVFMKKNKIQRNKNFEITILLIST